MLLRPRFADHPLRRARVEIIPLIDVIFFLLATFVLFTLSLDRIESVPVTLPRGGEGEKDALTLQVSEGGTVFWNREQIEMRELPGRLDHFVKYVDAPRVLIAGDDRAKFGPMVQVLDAVRRAGIRTFSVETRPRATGR